MCLKYHKHTVLVAAGDGPVITILYLLGLRVVATFIVLALWVTMSLCPLVCTCKQLRDNDIKHIHTHTPMHKCMDTYTYAHMHMYLCAHKVHIAIGRQQ